ncbi:hypothetical protein [Bartonella gabonensis]|uniref:hypothetical protein n=1 Tax=Bartonella gabonensis TaxID=2699889 RepID=UPI00158CFCE6|nr:hypothetical protein [Bartonella gabonensis]
MKYTLKLLIALFVMVGCCQAQVPQTIVDAWNKYGANQQEEKVLVYMTVEEFRKLPSYTEWCIANERDPYCYPPGFDCIAHFSRNLEHWE